MAKIYKIYSYYTVYLKFTIRDRKRYPKISFANALNWSETSPRTEILSKHSHKKRKDSLEHGPYCWYFRLNLKYLGWSYRVYIKTAKNGDFWEEFRSENDFEAILATFCCYDHCAKASEAVLKMFLECSLCVIICLISKIYLSINNSVEWLATRIPPT